MKNKLKFKKSTKIIISSILSVLFLYFFLFKVINWGLFFQNFSSYNFLWLIPSILLVITNIFFGVLRWQLLLKPFKKIKKRIIFKALMLSYFTNLVLPVNIGDIIRAYIIKKDENLKLSTTFGTIVADKLFSILALFLMGIILVLLLPIPLSLIEISQITIFGLKIIFGFLIGFALLIFLLVKFQHSDFFRSRLNEKFILIFNSFLKGITYHKSKSEIALLVLYSFIIRALYAFTTFFLVKGFGFEIKYYFFLYIDILVTFIHALGQHVLGIVGTYETTLTYALEFLGVSKEQGLFIALMSDFSYFIPVVIFGIYYFISEDWSLSKIRGLKK